MQQYLAISGLSNIEPHEAVPEVSRSKVHIAQNKHVPLKIDCDFLNTFHSISHATILDVDSKDAVKRTTLYYSVLHSTTPVILRTTQYYSSTTPLLLCTTKLYSSTTLCYKVLLQYYSVLQSTTPVLVCPTKYYSSTSLYYKVLLQHYKLLAQYYSVLLQYYSVLQSTTPVLLCTTKMTDPSHT